MNATQSWAGSPNHIKQQAAPDMLAGKDWYFYGCKIEHPGADELRRWAGIAPQAKPVASNVAGNTTAAEAGISREHARTREGKRHFSQNTRTRAGGKTLQGGGKSPLPMQNTAFHRPLDDVGHTDATGNIVAPGQEEDRQQVHSARDTTPKPMTRQEKRQAVDLALLRKGEISDRELARLLDVSHTFIAIRRRMLGNVAT